MGPYRTQALFDIFSKQRHALGRERLSATTSRTCIGIIEREPAIIQAVLPIHLHAQYIHHVGFVHHHFDAFYFVFVIARFFLVESQQITHARTSTALNANAQKSIFRQR